VDLAAQARAAATQLSDTGLALSGSVTVSAPESLLTYRLPRVLSRFRSQHPAVQVQIHPTPVGRFRGETRRAVASGAVELAVVLDARRERPGFGAEILRNEPISVVAPADHPLAVKRQVRPSDLQDETILLPEAPQSGCEYRGQFESH